MITQSKADGPRAAALFIERQIDEGIWRPGDKIPTERELVGRFGIARNTLRKSLDRLEASGKITRQVGRGTFVATESPMSGGNAESLTGLTSKILHSSPAEIMDARLMIEPQTGEIAAARATADDFASIEACLRAGEAAADIATFEEWDGRLHQAIIAASHNRLLGAIYDAINSVRHSTAWGMLKSRSVTPERRKSYHAHHRAIVAALRERDADRARDEIRAHLLAVKASFGCI